MRATFKGKVRGRHSHAVHLFYEYRGKEYMVTDEHNGYSEAMATKHRNEQERIDRELDTVAETKEPTYEADRALEAFFNYCETGDDSFWKEA